jgi:uncharacterized protein with HEPN domain
MPSDKARMALYDIRDNGKLAQDFLIGMSFEAFQHDRRTFYAVMRALQIVSEAAGRLAPEARARHPELPWRKIIGVGSVYRHNYENVAEQQVWMTVHDYLPLLLRAIDIEIARLDDAP